MAHEKAKLVKAWHLPSPKGGCLGGLGMNAFIRIFIIRAYQLARYIFGSKNGLVVNSGLDVARLFLHARQHEITQGPVKVR